VGHGNSIKSLDGLDFTSIHHMFVVTYGGLMPYASTESCGKEDST